MPNLEVTTPFRIPLPAGESTFTIHVPKHHLSNDRKFYFPHLHVAPDFFSVEADRLQIDADPAMDEIVEYPLQVKMQFPDQSVVYGPLYSNSKSTNKALDIIERINDHFEAFKPSYTNTVPFFIDWVDLSAEVSMPPRQYVPLMAESYYEEKFSHALHGDVLPQSVIDVDGVNKYLPPIGTMKSDAAYKERIRLRMWLAPFTRIVFSSNLPFVDELGFTEEQFGPRFNKQFHVTNNSWHWHVITADKAPQPTVGKTDFRISANAYSFNLTHRYIKASLSKREWIDIEKVTVYLKEMFNLVSRETNIVINFGFNNDGKKYYFDLPKTDNVIVTISCLPDFANRLGFGLENAITKGMQAEKQNLQSDIAVAQIKAQTVVFDTGPCICCLDQVSSNTTSGVEDQFMAILLPEVSGILSMPPSYCSCKANAMYLHGNKQSNAAFVPVTFRLSRIYDNGKTAEFKWKQGGYVYGLLQGFCA